MDAYYSSDEEVAWGPLSLREIKKELEKTPQKIKRRNSEPISTFIMPKIVAHEARSENKGNTSGTSAYFTPDESLQHESVSSKNDLFLEKLSKVIDGEVCTEKEETSGGTPKQRDTLLEILRGKDYNNLESINHTLVENTIILSSNEDNDESILNETSSSVVSCKEDSNDEIIVISEDSSTADSDCEVLYYSPVTLVKNERSVGHDVFSEEQEAENQTLPDDYSSQTAQQNHSSTNNSIISNNENRNFQDFLQNISSLPTEERMRLMYFDDDNVNISGVNCLLNNSDTAEEFTNSEATEATNSSVTDPKENSSNSLVFNDTMEEMEMALRQGLDYVMPGDEIKKSRNFEVPDPYYSAQKLSSKKKQHNKFDYVQSPIADYIKKKSPPTDHFKLPQRPPRNNKMTPTHKSPVVPSKQFKNIVSPVGIYIKNSPAPCFKTNVPVKTVQRLEQSPQVDVKRTKENVYSQWPEVVYRPAKQAVITTKTKIPLPVNIQKLVQVPVITTHTGRLHEKHLTESVIHEKLLQDDVSVDSSLLNQSGENISILMQKQAFIQ